jgi:hypothetical protein
MSDALEGTFSLFSVLSGSREPSPQVGFGLTGDCAGGQGSREIAISINFWAFLTRQSANNTFLSAMEIPVATSSIGANDRASEIRPPINRQFHQTNQLDMESHLAEGAHPGFVSLLAVVAHSI